MIKRIIFWLNNSRLFSLPMTFMSWIIVFTYAMKQGGNALNGILALIGISFAHLATNLFDDYIDYKTLLRNEAFIKNTTKSKCDYIKNGQATLNQLLRVVVIYCSISILVGLILTIRCGTEIIYLALIGGGIVLSYAKLSTAGLSELAVGTAFGPLLFEGVYYTMCGQFSLKVFLLSVAVAVFTVGLLYTHNLLDYDGDLISGKKTFCIRLGGKIQALAALGLLYGTGYIICLILSVIYRSYLYLLPLISIPFAVQLYRSVKLYFKDKNTIQDIKWWNYPLDGWEKIKQSGTASFYLRLYLARNIMVYFSILMLIAVYYAK